MPQVASGTKTSALKHARPNPMRPVVQANDRGQGSPFESMLDDNAPAASARARTPAPHAEVRRNSAPGRPEAASAKAPAAAKSVTDGKKPPTGKPAAEAEAIEGKVTGKTEKSGAAEKPVKSGKPETKADEVFAVDTVNPADVTATDPTVPAAVTLTTPAVPVATVGAVEIAAPAAPTPSASALPAPTASTPAAIEQAVAASTPFAAATDEQQPAAATDEAAAGEETASLPVPEKLSGAPPVAPQLNAKAEKTGRTPAAAEHTQAKPLAAGNGSRVQDEQDAQNTQDAQDAPAPLQAGKSTQAPSGEAEKPDSGHGRAQAATSGHHAASADPGAVRADSAGAAAKATVDAAASHLAAAHGATPSSSSTAIATGAPPTTVQSAPVPLAGVAVEIAGKALAGKNRFEIRLDPPELGRIDVRIDVDRNGHVTSRLIAERPETLDLLRRDASGLERALQDAGLKTSDNGLQFSLRDGTTGHERRQAETGSAQLIVNDETTPAEAVPQSYARFAARSGGLDIRV